MLALELLQGPDELSYDPNVVGDLGGYSARAEDVIGMLGGASWVVVGGSENVNGDFHAFLENEVGLIDLGTFGGPLSEAVAVNVFEEVVGWADSIGANGAVSARAFSWSAGSGFVDLGDLGGYRSWATDIDIYSSFICGTSETQAGDLHAFFLNSASGGMVDCGTLGGSWSQANATGNMTVVGQSQNTQGFKRAFLWSSWSGMSDLGALNGGISDATDISLNGYICGWSSTGNPGEVHAVFYQSFPTSQIIDLGTLGGGISLAHSINGQADVVGTSETISGDWHAFYWDEDTGRMHDLNEFIHPASGWVLESANHLTDSGWICGSGTFNGRRQGFVLRPFRMSVLGSTAGTNVTFRAYDLEPGLKVYFAASLMTGRFPIPGFPGLELGLHSPIRVASSVVGVGTKMASVSVFAPLSIKGMTIHFQAVVPPRYLVSPIFSKTFF